MKHRLKRFLLHIASKSPARIRIPIYKHYGICTYHTIGENIFIDKPDQLKVGQRVFINHDVQFTFGYSKDTIIALGDDTFIAPNVHFYCVSHNVGGPNKRAGDNIYASIIIGKGCWICADAILLPGSSVGDGSIVGAGSVVNCTIPPNELWCGNPARCIRKL